MDKETRDIFILGLCVLFSWAFVIILCASPQLFRELICRYCCCCLENRRRKENTLKQAQERMNFARKSFLATTLAGQPTAILLQQVMGSSSGATDRPQIPEVIPEESRCTSIQPTDLGSTGTRSHESTPDVKSIP